MAYLGNTPTTQSFISGTDYFNGTGAQTAFTLSRTVASVNDIEAVVNNVVQQPNDAYTISGTTITFTSAPSSGTNNVYVRYLSTTTQAITPSQGTVGTAQLGTITNIASGNTALTLQTGSTPTTAVTIDTSQNVGVGTTSPARKLTVKGSTGIAAERDTDTDRMIVTYNDINSYANSAGAYNTWTFTQSNNSGSVERMRIDNSGNLLYNSGYGSVAIAFACRAWVNFNGTTATPSTIRGSGNVSSISRTGTGQYTVNFSNAMPDANYSIIGIANADTRVVSISSLSTSSAAIRTTNSAGSLENQSEITVAVFR